MFKDKLDDVYKKYYKEIYLYAFSICRKIASINIDELNLISKDNTLENIIQNDNNRELYKSINRLSPTYREALYLFYFNELSVKEVAEIINNSYGSTKTLLSRARINLRKIIEEELE